MIRRSDCQTAKLPEYFNESVDLDTRWRLAMDVEQKKRLALLCFLWDTQHAVLFSQSLCMSAFELRTNLPCNPDAWESESAAEWAGCTSRGSETSFLSVLKLYMNPSQAGIPPKLNALSRLLILHGLMSVFWDMKRRDQTSLGEYDSEACSYLTGLLTVSATGSVGPTTEWKPRLGQAYDAWKTDFDAYCMNMTMQLKETPIKGEFTRFSTSTLAIYHAAHIVLNVEVLDLQIYAGARHIIGRPVSPHDYDRSRFIVKQWVGDDSTAAETAAWHAAQLLRDGVMNLEGWDVDQQFHYPWCLYLATLTCWAFHHAKNDQTTTGIPSRITIEGREENFNEQASMNALISSMTTVGPEGLGRIAGKQSTRGLVNVVAKHLGNIRWAVVYEGMKVLKGLEPETAGARYDYMR